MKMRSATVAVAAAIDLLNHARAVCRRLNPLGAEPTIEKMREHAGTFDSAIRARNTLQRMRDGATTLALRLKRF